MLVSMSVHFVVHILYRIKEIELELELVLYPGELFLPYN